MQPLPSGRIGFRSLPALPIKTSLLGAFRGLAPPIRAAKGTGLRGEGSGHRAGDGVGLIVSNVFNSTVN